MEHSNLKTFFEWVTQNWTQYSRCRLISAKYRGRILALLLLATLLVVQVRMQLAFLTTWTLTGSCSPSCQPAPPGPTSQHSWSCCDPSVGAVIISVLSSRATCALYQDLPGLSDERVAEDLLRTVSCTSTPVDESCCAEMTQVSPLQFPSSKLLLSIAT